MDKRKLLIALHEMKGIGWKSISRFMKQNGDLYDPLSLTDRQLAAIGLDQAKIALARKAADETYAAGRLREYERRGIAVVTVFDAAYPKLLRQIAQPPWVIYCIGDISLLQHPAIAVVGTRTPTFYGRKNAFQISKRLAEAGFTVVSGLARGIDSDAHRGALLGAAATIAVLGSGPDIVYPPEHGDLFREIAQKGLIVTEFPLGTKSHPGLFPLRNRIIAGLSLGTLVVEAALKSGSLITVDYALQESRDVFAMPGPIDSPKSQGPLSLIKQGAKLVADVRDILEEYGHTMECEAFSDCAGQTTETTGDEQKVLNLLRHEPASFDRLLELGNFEFGHLHAVLLSLLMKRLIEQRPGSLYALSEST
ncbi:MAG TPA: DNA-processing protein DprA [Bacilli bacterium]